MSHFILDADHNPVPCDLMTWARWFEDAAGRQVDRTELPNGYRVSTVCLGLDHRFGDDGPPLLFESMSFPGGGEQEQERYATWDEAKRGHAEMCLRVAEWPAR